MDAVNQVYNYSGDIMSHVSMYIHGYVYGVYKEAEQRKNGISGTSSLCFPQRVCSTFQRLLSYL